MKPEKGDPLHEPSTTNLNPKTEVEVWIEAYKPLKH
jgi:hypothetical protein